MILKSQKTSLKCPVCLVLCSFWLGSLLLSGSPPLDQDEDPLTINRPRAVFRTVLTQTKVQRIVSSYHNRFYRDTEVGGKEQFRALREYSSVGLDGPFVPRLMDRLGEDVVENMYRSTGLKFPYFPHDGNLSQVAKKNGAVFTFSETYGSGEKGKPACWDPAYMDAANAAVEDWLKNYGQKSWLSCILGKDEPLNYAGTIRNPDVVDRINAELKDRYGLKLSLSPQDPDLIQPWATTDKNILNQDPHDVALLRIAVWRWLNDRLYTAAEREYKIVKKYAPQLLYFAYNRNAICIMDFMSPWIPNSLDRLDQARYFDVTDGYSADPYPTFNLKSFGLNRALYHVGFVGKLITDLGAGKPSKLILQAFKYHDRLPTPGNLREWVSQTAKVGVTHLEWFGDQRTENPDLHREMMRLSRLWKDLPALDIPQTSEIGVIFSDDSRNALNDDEMNAYYLLHVLLGERLGAWYSFLGENQVRRGLQSLEGAKLLLAPQLSYVSAEFLNTLTVAVERGATLVLFDPEALIHDIETGSLAEQRIKLLGGAMGKVREASHLSPTLEGQRRFPDTDHILLQPGKSGILAHRLNVPEDAQVLFTFQDGKPAVYSRPLGKGEVLVFGAMPFGNCGPTFTIGDQGLDLYKPGWQSMLSVLCEEKGIRKNHPLWRFLVPPADSDAPVSINR